MKLGNLRLFAALTGSKGKIPFFECGIAAGFPKPTDVYFVARTNLNDLLIERKKSNTMYVVVQGEDMLLSNVMDGDLIIVDKSMKQPENGTLILCTVDGDVMLRYIYYEKGQDIIRLCSDMPDVKEQIVFPEMDFRVVGKVTFSVTAHLRGRLPWENVLKEKLDIHEMLVKNPLSTYFGMIDGDSMTGTGIYKGDMVVIDKLFSYEENAIILSCMNAEFTIKFIHLDKNDPESVWLIPANTKYPKIKVYLDDYFSLWGKVIYSITPHNNSSFYPPVKKKKKKI